MTTKPQQTPAPSTQKFPLPESDDESSSSATAAKKSSVIDARQLANLPGLTAALAGNAQISEEDQQLLYNEVTKHPELIEMMKELQNLTDKSDKDQIDPNIAMHSATKCPKISQKVENMVLGDF